MAGVDHLHAGVAVVCATKRTPVSRVGIEQVRLLSTSLQRRQQEVKWICCWRATWVSSHVHTALCDMNNCGWAPCEVWLHFDVMMTNLSVAGWGIVPRAAHHHIRQQLTRGTAGSKLPWQTGICTVCVFKTRHCCCCCSCCCWLGCQFVHCSLRKCMHRDVKVKWRDVLTAEPVMMWTGAFGFWYGCSLLPL